MNLSGLNGEVYIFTLRDLEMKVSRFKSKFVKVGEWFDWCDRLKIKFNGKKIKLPNCP